MIDEQKVEAAAKTLFEMEYSDDSEPLTWDEVMDTTKQHYRRWARAALNAANAVSI